MRINENQTYEEERALYGECFLKLKNCAFEGAADGESALKTAWDIDLDGCRFALRYPLWHCRSISLFNCEMTDTCRAALWYTNALYAKNSTLCGIKALRECKVITLKDCRINSPEFGWKCDGVTLDGCDVTSEYLFLDSKNVILRNVNMRGKYSFQYVENLTIENSTLDTKDAFWHTKNVTVKNCTVKGEYLGWYSENLTLIGCKISGTQPLCCCKGLRLIDCTMDGCDLSFELSDVEAEVKGDILSVKNPISGHITADGIGEIITEKGDCLIEIRA